MSGNLAPKLEGVIPRREPQLEPPGKGLPLFDSLILRFYTFPKLCRSLNWDTAQDLFDRKGTAILGVARQLSPEAMGTRVLVRGVRGIEDSSRFWSAGMLLEHLIIVGDAISAGMMTLSQGKPPAGKISIADVKPRDTVNVNEVINRFIEAQDRYRLRIKQLPNRNEKMRWTHPWLGGLNLYQWHCLAASHQAVHEKQLKAILTAL